MTVHPFNRAMPALFILILFSSNVEAQQANTIWSSRAKAAFVNSIDPPNEANEQPQTHQKKPEWNYGGFVDVGYLLDFNHPANDVFRSRGTTWHVDNVYI